MALTHKTTHATEALDRLLQQYRSPTAAGLPELLDGSLVEVQALEDALWAVLTERTVDAAIGAQLDALGAVLGVARKGYTDDQYRIRVRVQILLNLSSGTGEQLIAIFHLLEPSAAIYVEDQPPAGVMVRIYGVATLFSTDYAEVLAAARSAGVKAVLEFSPALPALTFTLDGTPAQALDAGLWAGSETA